MRALVLTLIILSITGVLLVQAGENKGAENMVLEGGSSGPVPFPHHRHQIAVAQCDSCHALFPQEKDGIGKRKADGQLASKQVMNKLCVQCHKERKKAGNASGPTTCTQCHRK